MRNRKAGCNAGLSVCIGCRRGSRRKMQEQYQATMITGLAGPPGVDQCGVSDLFRREYAVAVPIDPSIGLFNGHEKFGLGDRFVAIGVQGFKTVRGNEPARRREARSAALRSRRSEDFRECDFAVPIAVICEIGRFRFLQNFCGLFLGRRDGNSGVGAQGRICACSVENIEIAFGDLAIAIDVFAEQARDKLGPHFGSRQGISSLEKLAVYGILPTGNPGENARHTLLHLNKVPAALACYHADQPRFRRWGVAAGGGRGGVLDGQNGCGEQEHAKHFDHSFSAKVQARQEHAVIEK